MIGIVLLRIDYEIKFSALLAHCDGNPPATSWFPLQRPVTRSFDVFFNLRLNKRLSKQSGDLWRHLAYYNVTVMECECVAYKTRLHDIHLNDAVFIVLLLMIYCCWLHFVLFAFAKYVVLFDRSLPVFLAIITMMLRERHGGPDRLPLECLFNSYGLTSKKHEMSALLALCEGNPPVTIGFPSRRASNAESVSISRRQLETQLQPSRLLCCCINNMRSRNVRGWTPLD